MNKTAILGILVLFAVLTMPAASANPVIYFKPTDSIVSDGCGHTTTVEVWFDTSQCAPGTGINAFDIAINYDPNCTKIVDVDYTGCGWTLASWNETGLSRCWGPGYDWATAVLFGVDQTGDFRACTLTFQCCNSSCPYCATNLNFGVGYNASNPDDTCAYAFTNASGAELTPVFVNGTLTCGSEVADDFSKPLYTGWNLISLPLVPDDNSVSDVLSTVDYDAVYQYNATSKQFEAIESTGTMNPGTGYFVHATADCTWEYSGTAYNSMSTPLEPGLNMVGWLNCSKDVDALSSISGDYYYVARWNTAAEKFEVYNPVAPSTFDDFATMERGTGCFISAKHDCVLSEIC